MEPYLSHDDHVLTLNWVRPKIDDVIVFGTDEQYLIKRIAKIDNRKFKVIGDNKSKSSKLAPIDPSQIIGRVILKY